LLREGERNPELKALPLLLSLSNPSSLALSFSLHTHIKTNEAGVSRVIIRQRGRQARQEINLKKARPVL